jgi:hypothetical protein
MPLTITKRRRPDAAVLMTLALALGSAAPASAHPGGQHDEPGGHLPASSKNVELVGKLDNLTGVQGGIADVAAFGKYAYLNTYWPECTVYGGTGTGTHVVDISDPRSPKKVAFLPSEANSYQAEGVHVVQFGGRDLLVHSNESCLFEEPAVSGFDLWDVTNPLAAVKLGQFGDALPAVEGQTFHNTHSVQAFVWKGKAYAVAEDTQETKDVDIFDLTPVVKGTGPAVLVSEVGLEDWPAAQGPYANSDTVFHHDMQQKVINGHNFLAVSYWDVGQVLLNIDDPSAPVYLTDTDFPTPDPRTGFAIPEGNSHQSYWSNDGKYLLSTDEDFSPVRTLFRVTSGPNAGPYGAGEFDWTVPIPAAGITGTTVFGGSGCIEDANGNGVSDADEVPLSSATGRNTVVFSRGLCFFSQKVRTGEEKGYKVVVVGNSHERSTYGDVRLPDSFSCGSKATETLETAHAVCVGHRALHLLFNDPPAYEGPEGYAPGGDLPPIGTLGAPISVGTAFDGWGYVHLHDGRTLKELGTYAVPEALDPAYASGFGDLTVHEVKTDPRQGKDVAYFSYYAAGLRVATFGNKGIREVGHYIADGGNNFWGVYPLCTGACAKHVKDAYGSDSADSPASTAADKEKRPLLLLSDRDSGLWIFRYTGKEAASSASDQGNGNNQSGNHHGSSYSGARKASGDANSGSRTQNRTNR